MPYDIIKRGDKFVVQKQDGSKTFGTHDTREDADKQLAALNIAEKRHAESRTLHLLGALGKVTAEMVGKTEYLVVPVVALMEGVIHAVNAETPEFVPFETLQKCAESWNGKPITIGHPKGSDGKQCSASEAGIWDAHGIGKIRNARVDTPSKKMLMEALIETSRAKKLHPDMYQRLAEGGTEEVSVGAMVVTDHKSGKSASGKPYVGSWTFAEGDHLAFLPGGRGACSVAMGCGTHRAAMRICGDALEDVTESELRAPWEDKSGEDTHGRGGTEGKTAPEKSVIANKASKSARTSAQHEIAASLHREAANAHKAAGNSLGFAAHTTFASRHDARAVTAKLKGLEEGDTMKQDDAEENAELVMYQTMRSLWDSCDKSWDQVSALIDALIADETENPTETPEEEDAEEILETSRLESIRSICSAMMGCCQGILSATYSQSLAEDPPVMRGYAGARHNMADTKAIQAVHDHSMTLGAVCDRSNYKQLEGKLEDGKIRAEAAKLNDPVRHYIESVKIGAR